MELPAPELATSTSSLPLVSTNPSLNGPSSIHLSSDGDRLLISHQNQLYSSTRNSSGWTPLNLLNGSPEIQSLNGNDTIPTDGTIEAIATDASHEVIYSVETDNQLRWLSTWKAQGSGRDLTWIKKASLVLTGFAHNRNIKMQSNTDGSRLAIAGWDPSTDNADTPIMWRYDVHEVNSETLGFDFSINTIDSIRFPSTDSTNANLRFSADQSLSSVAMGWQSEIIAESEADSAMITYKFHPENFRWTPKLELPADYPTLAKRAFLHDLTLSADGSTLFLTVEPGHSPDNNNRVGEIIAFQ